MAGDNKSTNPALAHKQRVLDKKAKDTENQNGKQPIRNQQVADIHKQLRSIGESPVNPAQKFKKIKLERQLKSAKAAAAKNKELEDSQKATDDSAEFELLLQALSLDLNRLGELPQGPNRHKLKAEELIPKYQPAVEKYISDSEDYKNLILVYVMIWLFDTGKIDSALNLADIALIQKQSLPDRYKCNLHTFIARETLAWCVGQQAQGEAFEPQFFEVLDLITQEEWPIPEKLYIDYLKLLATHNEALGEDQKALENYNDILKIDPKAKIATKVKDVKKRIEQKSEKN